MQLQGSLLDTEISDAVGASWAAPRPKRLALDARSWVDHQPGWIAGSDLVFRELLEVVDWRADERPMYDRIVAVPRLTQFFREGEVVPHATVEALRHTLSEHYRPELGEPFASVGMCLYRDGRDSVAWHGDRDGRASTHDTVVAIVSLGSPRTLAFRRRDRGPTLHRFAAGHGDLTVMGGACQRTWDHGVPKTAAPVGPRISIQFRTRGVR